MISTKNVLCAALLIALGSAGVYAQSLKDAKPTLKTGNWTVLRSLDSMTDKVSCTGIYKSNYGVQLVRDSLFIKVLGGLESVTLRFGNDPVSPMRLPQKLEKDVGTVILEGTEFQKALDSNRLRLQVLTMVRGVMTEDLETTGIRTALDHIRDGCPVSGSTDGTPHSEPVVDGSCTPQLVGKLRAAGVSEKQISAACGMK